MDVKLFPARLHGTMAAIPSKSMAHRLLIAAALAQQPSFLPLTAPSADLSATIRCLRALGAQISATPGGLSISPRRPATVPAQLDCGESGSTLRFLLPLSLALGEQAAFSGAGRLPQRPLTELQQALCSHGVSFSAPTLPFTVSGRLTAGTYRLPGNISSQYISGLLLALPLLAQDSRIELSTPLESAAYVEMTIQVLRLFGVEIQTAANAYLIRGGQGYHSPGSLPLEGDWSNAAFFLAAGALRGPLTMSGLEPHSTQGDRAILPLLRRFGAIINTTGAAVSVTAAARCGIEADLAQIPDLLPILAVLAALADTPSRFYHGARLRLKESDRISATAALLHGLGGQVEQQADGLTVNGGGLRGGCVDGCNDHRIVMAAAIAASCCRDPVVIRGAQAVNKSYPDFFRDYQQLGGKIDVL